MVYTTYGDLEDGLWHCFTLIIGKSWKTCVQPHEFWSTVASPLTHPVLLGHDSGAAIAEVQGRQWEGLWFVGSKRLLVMTPCNKEHLKWRRFGPKIRWIIIHGASRGPAERKVWTESCAGSSGRKSWQHVMRFFKV